MTKVDLLHNLRVKFNELSLREYVIVEEAFEELQEDLKHKKIAIQNRKARIKDLEKENAELKKNYEDSLIACGVLKAKVDTLAQPSPLESMQDTLITTQKVAYEKQKKQLTKAKEIIKELLDTQSQLDPYRDIFKDRILKAEQFLSEAEK